MRNLRILFILILFLDAGLQTGLFAQNVVFSLSENVPAYVSPARMGDYAGNWQFTSQSRIQGYGLSAPYTSTLFSYEHKLYIYSQVIDFGLGLLHDKAASPSFPLNEIGLSVAHEVKVDSKSYLKLGLQFCFDNRQFDPTEQTFPEQYDRNLGQYSTLMPLSEAFASEGSSYFKLNAGLQFKHKGSLNWNIGFAGKQLNQPVESFFGKEVNLPIQWIGHASLHKDFNSTYFVTPSAIYSSQNSYQTLVFSIGGGVFLPKNSFNFDVFNLGCLLRYNFEGEVKDVGVNLGVTVSSWKIAINHDFNLSSQMMNLSPSTAVEVSLIYTRPSTEPKSRTISNQRF